MLAVLLALVSWLQIQKIGAIVTDINDSWLVSVVQLNEMKSSLAEVRRGEYRYVLTTDPAEWSKEEALRDAALQRYEQASKPYEATGISGPPEQKIYDDYRSLLREYLNTWATLRDIARAGEARHAEAVAFLGGPSRTSFANADAAMDKDINFNVTGAAVMRDKSNASLRDGALAIGLALAAVLALSSGLAWRLARSIVLPLRQAIDSARTMASGDLSRSIRALGTDEAGQLLAALSEMQTKLRVTVAGIQQSADQVGSASTQIASGNSDLSVRTEQQAANLQETSASIQQLSTTVVQGATSAKQAHQLASSAEQFAGQGGAVMDDVVTTMNGISTSSKRIADIIGVIDGIAFQTNILALNAAVEAAQAGDQGRGFAVVASEVRLLAKRSADAAREIKGLIHDSLERVDAGGQLVERAGATMTDIVDAVRKVAALIGEVSGAAAVQDAGFDQVGQAVNHLDETTQQNAALVEESAAAAISLRDQAERLREAVAQFRLNPV